jgi:hypothetical protein
MAHPTPESEAERISVGISKKLGLPDPLRKTLYWILPNEIREILRQQAVVKK